MNETEVIVMIIPVIGESKESTLSPIIVKGDIEGIETEVLNSITNPLKLANATAKSVKMFEDSLKEAEKKLEQKKKTSSKKKADTSKSETKEEAKINFDSKGPMPEGGKTPDKKPEPKKEKPKEIPVMKAQNSESSPGFEGNIKSVAEGNTEKVGVKSAEGTSKEETTKKVEVKEESKEEPITSNDDDKKDDEIHWF